MAEAVPAAAASARVHFLDGDETGLLERARRGAGAAVEFHAYRRARDAPPALRDRLTPARLVVVLADGREFADEAGVDVLRQLGRGAAPAELRPPATRHGLEQRLHATGEWLAESREQLPARLRWLRRSRFGFGAWAYLRLLGVAYALAFLSAALQQPALVGEGGLLPAAAVFSAPANGWEVLSRPSLLWLWPGDAMLLAQSLLGLAAAMLLIFNLAPLLMSLLAATLFLGVLQAGGIFYGTVPDKLLLEAGLLGALLAPFGWRPRRLAAPPIAAVWWAWLLLFRYLSLPLYFRLHVSDDWSGLESLLPRLQMDPLPSPQGWWLAHGPDMVLEFLAAVEITVLIFGPLLLLLGGNFRRIGGSLLLAWLLWTLAVRNTHPGIFVLLGLALLTLDDQGLYRWRRRWRLGRWPRFSRCELPTLGRQGAVLGFVLALWTGSILAVGLGTGRLKNPQLREVAQLFDQWHLLPLYEGEEPKRLRESRREFVLEGSSDSKAWYAYEFRDRVGSLTRWPPLFGPYLPRLAAMSAHSPHNPPWQWLDPLAQGVYARDPVALSFFSHNPFPDEPPVQLRLRYYEYRFAPLELWWLTGEWWQRKPAWPVYFEPRGPFLP
ncbi:MAG: lipase maturation factor family protein [Verrucomicrobiota bacterium]